MRYLILILILLSANSASASDCARSEFIGREMIKVGDSARKAFELEPDREWQLENRFGGSAGIRLDFYERGKTVQVTIRAGEVVRICRRRD